MTDKQIYAALERNKCCVVQVNDSAGHCLSLIEAPTPQNALMQLEEVLADFRGYKKLQIKAVEKKSTPWQRGFCWLLEFDKTEDGLTKTSAIGAIPIGAISPLDYVTMFKDMMNAQMVLQKELMEKQLQLNNSDPSKWIPVIQTVGPILGLNVASAAGGIAGPPAAASATTNELHFVGDIDVSKLSGEQLTNMIGEKLNTLSTQITGGQMLRLITALEKNKNLKDYADKVSKLLIAVAANPGILDVALAQLNIK